MFFLFKVLISAIVIATASELAKYNRLMAAIIISLPLVSILSFAWTYVETNDAQKIIGLSYNLFWLVLVSLIFYLILALLLKYNINFWLALTLSCLGMAAFYGLVISLYNHFI